MGDLVDRVRGAAGVLDYLNLLLCLHFLRGAAPERFDSLAVRARALRTLDEAAQLLKDIGRATDEDMRGIGVHSSMLQALERLEPRTARDLGKVVEAIDCLTEDVFGLILDEYERQAALGSGEFFTPRAVVRLMTRLTCSPFNPDKPLSVYDPYARDGGFLIEASAFCASNGQEHALDAVPRTYGETRRADTWRLATMNLLLHGVAPSLDLKRTLPWQDSSGRTPGELFDVVLSNPPFNMTDPGREERREGQWAFGAPPVDNDNFAWVQYCLARLRPGGRAGIIMPNKAGNSSHKADRTIRANLVERGCVECVIALPAQMFTGTSVPVSVWILRPPTDPCDSTLFLNARHMGTKNGPRRTLSPADVEAILETHHAFAISGEALHRAQRTPDTPVPGAVVSRADLRRSDYSLNPLDHVERRHDGETDAAPALAHAQEQLAAAEAHLRQVQQTVDRRILDANHRVPAVYAAARPVPMVALSSLCEIQAGPSYSKLGKKQRTADGTVPVVFPRHLKDQRVTDEADERVTPDTARRLRAFELHDQDIVCVRSGAITQPALIQPSQTGWLMSPNIIRLRVSEQHAHKVLPEYLFHYLCLDETVAWMQDRAAATAAPSLRTDSLGSLRIPLPDPTVQHETVTALHHLDELDRAHRAVASCVRRTRTALADTLLTPRTRTAPDTPAHDRPDKETP
ncbi:type I restriction-modification system subunit M/S [Streptomyces sp. NRRL F-5727]|uniref:type I restriction-modification system subunit M/S n=1 Tax=Streptomyces sp. NRRL F-5727 TaxID=1463871 RepID=UPI00131C4098|nr:type I restriction-modification system subunit M/S [Streptomyces sp. NRRL F-5727]